MRRGVGDEAAVAGSPQPARRRPPVQRQPRRGAGDVRRGPRRSGGGSATRPARRWCSATWACRCATPASSRTRSGCSTSRSRCGSASATSSAWRSSTTTGPRPVRRRRPRRRPRRAGRGRRPRPASWATGLELSNALSDLGFVASAAGDLDEAASLQQEALTVAARIGAKPIVAQSVDGVAEVVAARGDPIERRPAVGRRRDAPPDLPLGAPRRRPAPDRPLDRAGPGVHARGCVVGRVGRAARPSSSTR